MKSRLSRCNGTDKWTLVCQPSACRHPARCHVCMLLLLDRHRILNFQLKLFVSTVNSEERITLISGSPSKNSKITHLPTALIQHWTYWKNEDFSSGFPQPWVAFRFPKNAHHQLNWSESLWLYLLFHANRKTFSRSWSDLYCCTKATYTYNLGNFVWSNNDDYANSFPWWTGKDSKLSEQTKYGLRLINASQWMVKENASKQPKTILSEVGSAKTNYLCSKAYNTSL